MTAFVVTMAATVLTAVGVLAAVFTMHLVATSPRLRARVRRGLFAATASAYTVRRAAGRRLQRGVAMAGNGVRRGVTAFIDRMWHGAAAAGGVHRPAVAPARLDPRPRTDRADEA